MKKNIRNKIESAVESVRENNPMAGSVTNMVTIKLVANVQLALGGSAAMVYLPDEAANLARAGRVLYVNVGTMQPIYKETFPGLAKVFKEEGIPWVLDPVGLGVGGLRAECLQIFKGAKPDIIRANASEIIGLAKLWGLTDDSAQARGVDSIHSVERARDSALALAKWTGGAVAVSGEIDLITDGKYILRSYGGSPMMERITGAGCALGGACAVYLSQTNPFIAATTATAVFNLAGLRAEARSHGPGSFEVEFLDQLYQAQAKEISGNRFEIQEV